MIREMGHPGAKTGTRPVGPWPGSPDLQAREGTATSEEDRQWTGPD